MSSMNSKALASLVVGVVFMVIGMIFGGTIIAIASTSSVVAQMGSFTGLSNLNNIFPFLYYALLLVVVVVFLFGGIAGMIGKGPLKE